MWQAPVLPGVSLHIHKMELLTQYLPYRVVRKIRYACSQLGGQLVVGCSLTASFRCLVVDGDCIYWGASGVVLLTPCRGCYSRPGASSARTGSRKASQGSRSAAAQHDFHWVLCWARPVAGPPDLRHEKSRLSLDGESDSNTSAEEQGTGELFTTVFANSLPPQVRQEVLVGF